MSSSQQDQSVETAAGSPRGTDETRAKARRTMWRSLGLVVFMGALSFAAVPFYDYICRVTGFSGTTQRAEKDADRVVDQFVTVRFDASIGDALPWRFEPAEKSIRVRIGETHLAFYRATNLSDRPVTGSASFNVTPFEMGSYFSKIDCFCFTEQTLQPGETVDMPVSFFLDPEMIDDVETQGLSTVTLSYTFYEQEKTAADGGEDRSTSVR